MGTFVGAPAHTEELTATVLNCLHSSSRLSVIGPLELYSMPISTVMIRDDLNVTNTVHVAMPIPIALFEIYFKARDAQFHSFTGKNVCYHRFKFSWLNKYFSIKYACIMMRGVSIEKKENDGQ